MTTLWTFDEAIGACFPGNDEKPTLTLVDKSLANQLFRKNSISRNVAGARVEICWRKATTAERAYHNHGKLISAAMKRLDPKSFEYIDDEFCWMGVLRGTVDGDLDLTFTIAEEAVRENRGGGGASVIASLTKRNGEIVYQFTPYNFGPRCWTEDDGEMKTRIEAGIVTMLGWKEFLSIP